MSWFLLVPGNLLANAGTGPAAEGHSLSWSHRQGGWRLGLDTLSAEDSGYGKNDQKVNEMNFCEESHRGTENAKKDFFPLSIGVVAVSEMTIPQDIRDIQTHTTSLRHISR